jgi:hypothetical protein
MVQIWIGALCINQQMLRNDVNKPCAWGDISRATKVIAWSGPEENDSGKAMLLITTFGSEAAPKGTLGPTNQPISAAECHPEDIGLWKALSRLFAGPHWQRAWILKT